MVLCRRCNGQLTYPYRIRMNMRNQYPEVLEQRKEPSMNGRMRKLLRKFVFLQIVSSLENRILGTRTYLELT